MEEKKFVENISDFNTDLSSWYTDVVLKADFVDYGPVKGTMIIKPYGYALWEKIQEYLNDSFKKQGVQNAYFPMFIPESFLKREAEHVEGFAPEVAVVTYAGGQELSEKLIVRPTSETIICEMYAKWIKSYRDLPVKLNQCCNVVRWEKTTRPFLRTSEFLWQEGHTVQASQEDAIKDAKIMLDVYKDMCKNLLAMPLLSGKKSEHEKFAGALETYGIEAVMPNGVCLQAGTSHNLGQNFAKASNIKFLNKNGEWEFGYSTSWGVSTRLLGAVIMVHGDERGVKLPPRLAPIQTVIVPIAQKKEGVLENAELLKNRLEQAGVRVKLDATDNSPGWKFNEYELKGVPLRLEMGPRDIENGVCQLVRRDTHEKLVVALADVENKVKELLDEIQENLYKIAEVRLNNATQEANTMEEMKEVVESGKVAIVCHCGEIDCEADIKNETTIKSRVIIENVQGCKCIKCSKPAKYKAYFGKQY